MRCISQVKVSEEDILRKEGRKEGRRKGRKRRGPLPTYRKKKKKRRFKKMEKESQSREVKLLRPFLFYYLYSEE